MSVGTMGSATAASSPGSAFTDDIGFEPAVTGEPATPAESSGGD